MVRGTGKIIRGTGKMMRGTGEMMRGTGEMMRSHTHIFSHVELYLGGAGPIVVLCKVVVCT